MTARPFTAVVARPSITGADRDEHFRVGVAARVDREDGAAQLARLADDTSLNGYSRVWAAEALTKVDWEAGTVRLVRFARDTPLDRTDRREAARVVGH
ncbi:hypothetical protein [Streptomyces sp. NBC_01727]|uniref:hypothetical protein n=1 Tax=Streptomyces sp. NBC_01727 TaxID=2975924 RepID=UPI002E15C712|nr:hypothetical protein OIE76_39815 [Streptomyces sp. NBC_01727]